KTWLGNSDSRGVLSCVFYVFRWADDIRYVWCFITSESKNACVVYARGLCGRVFDHFYNVIRLYKQGKVKNLASYLYVTWERVIAEISRRRCSKYGAVFREFSAISDGFSVNGK